MHGRGSQSGSRQKMRDEEADRVPKGTFSEFRTMSETSVLFLKDPPPPPPPSQDCTNFDLSKMSLLSGGGGGGVVVAHPLSPPPRPFDTLTFVGPEATSLWMTEECQDIEAMSTEEQEDLLIQELLWVLQGVDATLIKVVHHPGQPHLVTFGVDGRVELPLKELALRIARIATYYHAAQHFTEKFNTFRDGIVNQALCGAIFDILTDYLKLVCQMESMYMEQGMSLQKMWFFINPTLKVLAILNEIVVEIERQGCRGGAVLSLLHEKNVLIVGDEEGQKLCAQLAEKASAPYFCILESWIYKGMIKDPFYDFFVIDNEKDDVTGEKIQEGNDNYWENRYVLEPSKCPVFLAKVSREILQAGKYLNVIRQCGKDVSIHPYTKIKYSTHERVYVEIVEKAYAFASQVLLDLLLNEYDLMRRLQSVKHYLLMDQGDFIVQFLDLTENELRKQVDDLNPSRLESLLELALRTSSSTTDPYKDSVKVQLFSHGIQKQMEKIMRIETPLEHQALEFEEGAFRIPGVEGFSFTYEVTWPISLILHPRVIICYQMIFRHLFFCKHVERQLCKVWLAKKSFKDSSVCNDSEKAAVFSLRQNMLNFVQNLQYYMAFEVIEPAWHAFLDSMNKVTNVDQVLEGHFSMVNSILDDAMLTNHRLLAIMTKLLSLCLQFSEKILGESKVQSPQSPNNSIENPFLFLTQSISVEELTQKFNTELVEFLREVRSSNQSSKVTNIIYRVNFNGFYTKALDEGVDVA